MAADSSQNPERIRVIASTVGGGFGGKTTRSAEEFLVPILARRLGRPVRWADTRSEYFATAPQGRGERISLTLAGGAPRAGAGPEGPSAVNGTSPPLA